jgi:hypothetical protein
MKYLVIRRIETFLIQFFNLKNRIQCHEFIYFIIFHPFHIEILKLSHGFLDE